MKKNFTIIAANITGEVENTNTTTAGNLTPGVSGAWFSLHCRVLKMTFLAVVMLSCFAANAQINIGSNSAPDASAVLQTTSTTKGFLPPRLTQAQRNAISTPTAGLMIYCTNCASGEVEFYNGTNWANMGGSVPNVTNPATGKTWMDRNLGASEAAVSSQDVSSYGDLYQWGRLADGHQSRTSATTPTLSSTDAPGNDNFILAPSSPYDWRSGQNVNLWQGVSGINNPCPSGYRLPTDAELASETATWSAQSSVGAFGSVLKMPMAGDRTSDNGSLNVVGSYGHYWSSTVSGSFSRDLYFSSGVAGFSNNNRAYGFSVRCIMN